MIDELTQIMINIQRGFFKYIGSGSGRDVFDLRNGYVVKIAKNKAGIAQNRVESIISSYDSSDLFAKVMYVADNFHFLIMEKATRIDNFSYIYRYFNVADKKELSNLSELQDIQGKYTLLRADLLRISSWGILNGRPVIIDYGYTKAIADKYY